MSKVAKTIVEEVLTVARARELWTANYLPALPLTPQNVDLGAVLPAMLYMARWGHRRGKGTFRKTFGGEKALAPTVRDVAHGLLQKIPGAFSGFGDPIGTIHLTDLLLTYCLENKDNEEGHDVAVQRVLATHYLSSHIDLPDAAAHLRGVPESLTALLAWCNQGDNIESGRQKRSAFAVGEGFQANPLLKLFWRYMSVRPPASDQASDIFNEQSAIDLGIDELLSVRIAQACGRAPDKSRASKTETDHRIPNRWPIAERAAEHLRSDLTTFIAAYGMQIPRQAFSPMLEAGFSLGLTNILLSTANCLFEWERVGSIPREEKPWPLFVDASMGQDKDLRKVSEAVMSDCLARFDRVPDVMMQMRLLDQRARVDRRLADELPSPFPDARPRLDLLGRLIHEEHPRAESILDQIHEDGQRLAEALSQADEAPEAVEALKSTSSGPVQRMAQALVNLMGSKLQAAHYRKALDSFLMIDRPNGLALKRPTLRTKEGRKGRVDLREIVLSNTMLDFLVHRQVRKDGKGTPGRVLSLKQFLGLLRTRYGLYVDREPRGFSVPPELLRHNKQWLERRLRDLGLLVGVNDAESMKQLRARFGAVRVESEAADVVA